ncbi:Helicase associated domain protein [Streptomyces sp. NBC_00654]|uniref:DEAD/DEAH box helicase n=1 Tax=Streptomyces sp. NBC_00654 TaxID=2975799 RepID=UPI0022525340|nr:DEAD/DEAH box helicase [Streptomyces sp. NBC_00654]MCX4971265.1 Helicase associated domain protein [Streptomyces sp. NBC_00654]
MADGITLRPHQAEAVEAIVSGLEIRPGQRIPEKGMRGQVHAACGTGKTFIAAGAAQRISPHGRVLVLVPTLELLAQTVREWRAFGRSGPMVAVCSLEDDPRLYDLRVPSTTSAPQLALHYGSGPVTAFATYASLPVLIEAHEGSYGLPMDVWDLVAVDEAHRTSGSLGKAWAAVHDQEQIPAMRRLYLTATPRIWMERPPRRWAREAGPAALDRLPEEMACSMADEKIFGPVLWAMSLSDAITRGLLARYQIVVVELRDERLTLERLYGEERNEEHVRGERLAVLQAALLETMSEHRLQRCITFHHRTIEARAFSEGLGRIAARLHAADPERHPGQVWTGWLSGEHQAEMRADELRAFGARAGRAVMSNCRVLGEGVDVPSVDSVALIDPKGSAVDIVQAIGRALRQKPGQNKLATLIVPVFLGMDETPEDMPYSGSYRPLLKVLSGLRAHDERAVEMLAIPQEDIHRTAPASSWIGEAPEEDAEEERVLLRFGAHRDPVLVARLVKYNLIEPEHANWRAGHRAAVAYREREGDLAVPYNHIEGETGDGTGEGEDRSDDGSGFPLGRWLSDQRRAMRAGTLLPERAADLEELDVVWDPADAAWEENLGAARAYFAAYGTLAAPVTAAMMDRPIGQWLANARKKSGLGKDPVRAERRAELLAGIDPDWRPDWPVDWQRHYAALASLVTPGKELGEVEAGAVVHGMDVGRWLAAQRQDWDRLATGQRERLAELGVTPAPRPATPARKARQGRGAATGGAFGRGVAALAQYVEREGHERPVPRKHEEPVEFDGQEHVVKLGVFISNTKTRRHRLTQEQRQALAGLGMEWA